MGLISTLFFRITFAKKDLDFLDRPGRNGASKKARVKIHQSRPKEPFVVTFPSLYFSNVNLCLQFSLRKIRDAALLLDNNIGYYLSSGAEIHPSKDLKTVEVEPFLSPQSFAKGS